MIISDIIQYLSDKQGVAVPQEISSSEMEDEDAVKKVGEKLNEIIRYLQLMQFIAIPTGTESDDEDELAKEPPPVTEILDFGVEEEDEPLGLVLPWPDDTSKWHGLLFSPVVGGYVLVETEEGDDFECPTP